MRLGDLDLLNQFRVKEDGKYWWRDHRNEDIDYILERIPEIKPEHLPEVIDLKNKLSKAVKEISGLNKKLDMKKEELDHLRILLWINCQNVEPKEGNLFCKLTGNLCDKCESLWKKNN